MVATVPTEKCPELSVLGTFRFGAPDGPLPVSIGSQRLLAFLGLSSRAVMHANVARALWPDVTDERASARLRSTMARLEDVGGDAIVVTTIDLRLADEVKVDIHDSRALAHRILEPGTALTAADSGAAALAALSVDLLPDWCDDWVVVEAEEWRQLRLRALEALAERTLAEGRYAQSTDAALAVVRAEPLRESGTAALIRVHLAQGNQAEALAEYSRYRAVLHRELGLEPTVNLRGLIATITPAHGPHDDNHAHRAFKVFDATPAASSGVRAFVRETITRFADVEPAVGALVEVAALLAAELFADALVHGAAEVHVLALCRDDHVRIELYDTRRSSYVSVGEAPEVYGVRMRILNDLADRWSMEYVGSGQLNWFELHPHPARMRPGTEPFGPLHHAPSTSKHSAKIDRARNWLRHCSLHN